MMLTFALVWILPLVLTYSLVGRNQDIDGLARGDHHHCGIKRLQIFSISCNNCYCVICNLKEVVVVQCCVYKLQQVGVTGGNFQRCKVTCVK